MMLFLQILFIFKDIPSNAAFMVFIFCTPNIACVTFLPKNTAVKMNQILKINKKLLNYKIIKVKIIKFKLKMSINTYQTSDLCKS